MWHCIEHPIGVAALASVGSWAIAFSGQLAKCTGRRRCTSHGTCRRCIRHAALLAVRQGFGGLCFGCGAAAFWPQNSALIASLALLAGLGNYQIAQWRSLGDALLEALLASRSRGKKKE